MLHTVHKCASAASSLAANRPENSEADDNDSIVEDQPDQDSDKETVEVLGLMEERVNVARKVTPGPNDMSQLLPTDDTAG